MEKKRMKGERTEAGRPRTRGRPKGAEPTRARILDAASELIARGSFEAVSLDEVAERAGFSRRTIYDQFGSKRGILIGILERIADEGLPTLLDAVHQANNPFDALRQAVPLSVAYTDRYINMMRIFYAQAINDPDFRAAWDLAQKRRWDNLHRIVEWLAREKRLAEGWDLSRATDWLFWLTSFQLHDELIITRGWSKNKLADMIMLDINRLLIAG
jgi:AcrR family transcriptional regulator